MKKTVLFFILGLCQTIAVIAQVTVNGRVSDTSGLPIPGATVHEKGTQNGVITDVNGNYRIQVSGEQSILVFSFVGMETQEILVGGQDKIDVILEEALTDLEEVVVIGYGVQKKKLTTGANLNISGDDLQSQKTSEPLEAIQSQSPGVNIIQSSGMPGEGFKVNIRGLGTIGNSAPLYVIDGVAGGDINNLNPADIESIDVLKDAASAAIYGARAANGVILVTTKQGKKGKMEVSYDGYFGFQDIENMVEPLNAKQFMEIYNEERVVSGKEPIDFASIIPELYQKLQSGTWNGTNWLKETYNKNAPIQNHAISISGGSDQSVFSLGFSYASQEGVFGKPVEPHHDKYTFRLNSNHVILEKNGQNIIRIGETLNFSSRERSGIAVGGMYWNDIRNMLVGNPLVPVYNDDGEYFASDDLDQAGLSSLSSRIYNPLAQMHLNRGMNETTTYNINSNAFIEIQPIPKLIFRSSYGFKMNSSRYRSFQPEYNLAGDVTLSPGRITQSSGNGHDWTFENTLNYSFDLGFNSFDILIGQSAEKWGLGEEMETINANPTFESYKNAYIDTTDGLTTGVTSLSGGPFDNRGSLASFFGRVNYDFNEKYLLTFVMRADGSSNFAKGNRWGYFPSISAGWVLSEEDFIKDLDFFDFLKLRGSWGQNGNHDIESFQYLSIIGFDDENNYTFGLDKTQQQLGGYPAILPNPDVTWETSEQVDIGLDAYFLKSKLQLTFDYYKKTTKDWLVEPPILDSDGPAPAYVNGGDIVNKGFEFSLRWNDTLGPIDYSAHFNFSHNDNEVTKLGNASGYIASEANIISQGTDPVWRVETGYPVGYFYGYKTAGIFQNQQQIDNWTHGFLQENPQPGDVIFLDTNGDGAVTPDDKTMIGNPHPDIRIGFGFSLNYKGLDFSFSGKGAFGHQILKSYRSFADNEFRNYTTEILNRWHGEGTSNSFPRLTAGNGTNRINISEIYIEDGDFIKISNVTLGYDFKKLITDIPLGQVRLYLAARNLWTFTDYSGMDPEVGYGDDEPFVSGIDLGFYPSPRTFLFGVNIKF
ncbi:SusC/RagA family TonB-linked outer membrane protein [Thermophagus xiamenensis]|uniref:TonB-linked outer membrane protein, SusC/RagA family n=1 Tax=Thermophagus xiamenensis TaxID=385682 RepID=A0A1I2C949_9BACT|nr:TonB-dependent receptor [Thermophagus xiamenensis]SFE64856.1 TonB-linked outer membrane protein, SusC/RagA family [Thermophagus xiamenensis]